MTERPSPGPQHPSLFDVTAQGSRKKRPRPSTSLVDRLCAELDRRAGWVSASTLATVLDVDDRAIREAAQQSAGRVLGGQRGYCLTARASLEDVQLVTRALLSQAARMRQRVLEIERVRHRLDPYKDGGR